MTLANPVEVPEAIAERLHAAVIAHTDAQEVAKLAAKAYRQLVVEAVDAGIKIKDVATMAGVSPPRIHAIIVAEDSRP